MGRVDADGRRPCSEIQSYQVVSFETLRVRYLQTHKQWWHIGIRPNIADCSVLRLRPIRRQTRTQLKSPKTAHNRLYYGDNLDILPRAIAAESVDLIDLDPPFNSQREYNLIFREQAGTLTESQQQAFLDAWDWTQAAETYEELANRGGHLAEVMRGFHAMFGPCNFLAYLAMMGARLVELHRVLRTTGSIYLHCDATASHYIKVMMDAVFGPQHFVNEIIWKRSTAHSDKSQGARHFGRLHDTLLLYSKSNTYTWSQLYDTHDPKYVSSHYPYTEETTGKRYGLWDMTGPGGAAKGNPQYEVMGVTRFWRYRRDKMDALMAEGRIVQPRPGAVPRYKRYLGESAGRPIQDIWTDIAPLNSQALERRNVGFPTQKPESLLERVLRSSSKEGDVVLDPFCGCGTTIAAAQKLNRRWIGIDITARAIDIIVDRLRRDFGSDVDSTYRVEQYPYSVADARRLARENPFHFQRWALERLGVRPSDIKPGADRGIDGKLYFSDGAAGRTRRVVLSVKGGARVTPRDVRELRGVLDRDGFQMGALVSAEELTDAAREDLVSGIRYYETSDGRRYPRLQSLTIKDIFAGRRIAYPDADRPAVKTHIDKSVKERNAENLTLDFEGAPVEPRKISRIGRPKTAKVQLPAHPSAGGRERSARRR